MGCTHTSDVPLDGKAGAARTVALQQDWLREFRRQVNINLSWGGTVSLARQCDLPVHWQRAVGATHAAPLQWQLRTQSRADIPVDYQRSTHRRITSPIDWAGVIVLARALNVPVDWQRNLARRTDLVPDWQRLFASTTRPMLIDHKRTVGATHASPLQWQVQRARTLDLPLDWQRAFPGRAYTLPFDWRQSVGARYTMPIAWQRQLARVIYIPVAWRGTLVIPVTLPDRWIYLFDLNLPTLGTLKYSDYHADEVPAYYAKISPGQLPRITKSLPNPLTRLQEKREATIILSNLASEADGAGEGLTGSQIVLTDEILGRPATLRRYDLTTGQDVMRIDGVVSSYELGEEEWTVTVRAEDDAVFQNPLPALATTDLFPSADLSTVQQGQDHCPIIPFSTVGPLRKADLALLVANDIFYTFTMAAVGGNFLHVDLTNVPNYAVQAGNVLVYDLLWDEDSAFCSMDLWSATQQLNIIGATDQNGLSSHASTNLNAYARNKWYRRRIALPAALVGQTLTTYVMTCRASGATKHCRIANAAILDAGGVVRVQIFDQNITPTFANAGSASGSNSFNAAKEAVWDYGPIRGHAGVAVPSVYRDGRVVNTSEYTFATTTLTVGGQPVKVLRFTHDQRENGRLLRIQADLTSSEFADNHANVEQFLLADATYGLDQLVNAAAFTTAATDFSSLGYKVGGGLSVRQPAFEVLRKLHVHGTMLDRDTSGEMTITVDTEARHTTGLDLGRGDDRGLLNVVGIAPQQSATLDDRIRAIVCRGIYDPGFDGNGAWLVESTHSRVITGGRIETVENEYLDTASVDREAYYLLQRIALLERLITARVLQEAVQLQLNQITTVYAPHYKLSGVQHEVRQRTMQGIDVDLLLAPFTTTPFNYTSGTQQKVDPKALYITDFSQTFPEVPTALSITHDAYFQTGTGEYKTRTRFSATAPSTPNITAIHFKVYKASDLVRPWLSNVIAATAGQAKSILVEAGTTEGLVFAASASASGNAPGFQEGAEVIASPNPYTTPNSPGAPTAPSAIAVRQSGAKVVEIDLTFTEPAGQWTVEWYRNTTNNSGTASLFDIKNSKRNHDTNVTYGTTYFYWGKVRNAAGQTSGFSPSSSHSLAIARLVNNDVGDDQIDAGHLIKTQVVISASAQIGSLIVNNAHINDLHGAKITAGTITASQLTTASAVITQTAQIANVIITTAKIISLAASKIVTETLQINPGSGADALVITNGGDLAFRSDSGTSRIEFQTAGAALKAFISSNASTVEFVPFAHDTQIVSIGGSARRWNQLDIYGTNSRIDASNFLQLVAPQLMVAGTFVENASASATDSGWRLRIQSTSGVTLGYIGLKNG